MPGIDSLPDFRRLQQKVVLDSATGCWLWQGAINADGYGRVGYKGRTGVGAHRVSYEVFVGPIARGLHLDHLCRVRHCINPDHLEPVSVRENIMRGDTPARRNAERLACINGHPLAGPNLYPRPDGSRGCRECRRAAGRRHDAKRRAK